MDTKEISKKETLDWPFMPDFPSLRDWFEDFTPERFSWINSSKHAIKVEELIRENEIVVRAELPGIDPDNGVRTSPLPAGTTEKDVKATYKDGILEVHIPTPELTEMPKRIPIHKM